MNTTIAAIATAPVRSAIGVLRLSGPDALPIARKVAHVKTVKPRRVTLAGFYADGVRIDEGLFVYMKAPASYTGEDTVEFYCHGSSGVLEALLDALYRAGAVPAKPGEYTRRAYENGRLDLVQAEAVVDLIDSETRASARNAAAQLKGALGQRITPVRDALIELCAHFSAVIDYPDDDVPELLIPDAIRTLDDAAALLRKLADSGRDGAMLKNGAVCVLAGAPNVGKSSLLNALTGEERAIVTDIPGTTRDVVEACVTLSGIPVRLLDTAGLRDTADIVERAGVERTRRAMENADLIIAVHDGESVMPELPEGVPVLRICGKSDLGARMPGMLAVSAETGEGIPELKAAIAQALRLGDIASDGSTVTNPRQADVLRRAYASVVRAKSALTLTPDAAMSDIEDAAAILGELTGQTASEDILAAIFSRFCVGK
ncbi:MAG: tRNA uridine-5-carboxymethylaminomethyl(34) synthesis GTPase MnmE [Eubacteriales bacterium]|jgi:tRNA modification GTPase